MNGASHAVRQSKTVSRTVRAARRRGEFGRIAIKAVLADVEVERRKLHGAEGVQLGEQAVEGEVVAGLAQALVQLDQAMENPALQLGHLGDRDTLTGR